MHAALAQPIELAGGDARDRHACSRSRELRARRAAASSARAATRAAPSRGPRAAPRDRVDAVDRSSTIQRRSANGSIGSPVWSSPIHAAAKARRTRARARGTRRSADSPRRRRQLGAAIDRRHREIELRPFGAAGQRDPNRMKQRLRLLTGPRLHAVRGRAKPLAIEPRRAPPAPRQAPRPRRARRRRVISARIARRRAPRPASSRTGTPAAPAPGRADRPTPVAIGITDARNASPLGRRRHPHAGSREVRHRRAPPAARDPPSSDSGGSPTRASPRRTRRRCGRRRSSEKRRASSLDRQQLLVASPPRRPADQREVVDERLRQVALRAELGDRRRAVPLRQRRVIGPHARATGARTPAA